MEFRSSRSNFCLLVVLIVFAAISKPIGVVRAGESLAIVDALILYTGSIHRANPVNLPYWLSTMVERANDAFLNSGAPLRLRAVHTAKVSYEEGTATLDGSLHHLLDPTDGQLDEVGRLRDHWNADVVILVTGSGDNPGYAAPLAAGMTNAFVVLNSLSDFTLAKALGRLAGCGPDVGSTRSRGLYDDSRSHHRRLGEDIQWGTLMSELIGNLTVFSNPSLSWQGQPLGQVGVANNVRVLRMRAVDLASFRSPLSRVDAPEVKWVTPATDLDWTLGQPIRLELAAAQGESPVVRVEILKRGSDFYPIALSETGEGLWKRTQRAPEAGWHHYVGRVTDRMGWISQAERVVRVHAANDTFSLRQTLGAEVRQFQVVLGGASLEPGEPGRDGRGTTDGSVWFSYTPDASGELWISGDENPKMELSVWQGESLTDLTPAGPVKRHLLGWSLPVEAGRSLQLAFTGSALHSARDLRLQLVQAADNDRFERRRTLTPPSTEIASFDNATPDPSFPWPEGYLADWPVRWWTWVPSRSGVARLHFPDGARNWPLIGAFQGSVAGQLHPFLYGSNFLWAEHSWFTSLTNLVLLVQKSEPVQLFVGAPPGSPPTNFRLEYAPVASNHVFGRSQILTGTPATALLREPGPTEPTAPSTIGPLSLWYRWKAPESGTVFLTETYSGASRSFFEGETLARIIHRWV